MKKNSLLFLISCLIIIGCARDCPDFNDDVVQWIPYKEADNIEMTNSTGTETLVVNSSKIYHSDEVRFGVKCACENAYILNLSSNSFNIDIRFNDSRNIESSEIVINGEWLDFLEQRASITINGKAYQEVILYESLNQLAAGNFIRVIVSKSFGIIAIIGNDEEWSLINETKRVISITDIDFLGKDC